MNDYELLCSLRQVDDVTGRANAHPNDSKALAKRIGAEVAVKCVRYALVATSIGHAVPSVLTALGLPCT